MPLVRVVLDPNGDPKLALPKLEAPGEEVDPNGDFIKIDVGAAGEGPGGVATDLAKIPEGTLGGTGESSRLLLLLLLLDCAAAADVGPPPNRLPVEGFEKRGGSALLLLLLLDCAAADVAPPPNRLPVEGFEKRGRSTLLTPEPAAGVVVAAPKPNPNAPGAFDGIGG
jgi:hypothetical protein